MVFCKKTQTVHKQDANGIYVNMYVQRTNTTVSAGFRGMVVRMLKQTGLEHEWS